MKQNRTRLLQSIALACLAVVLQAHAADSRINLALASNGAVATQKDNPFGMPASRGNDGLIVEDATFAHTGNADNEWWEVDLGAQKSIAEVRLWLRNDNNIGARDSNLRLVIYSDAAHSSVVYSSDLPDGALVPIPYRNILHALPSTVTGQVVRIEHPPGIADYLQINEVQVFSQTVEEVNLALKAGASQSTTWDRLGPELAVDGFASGIIGDWRVGSTTHTAGAPANDLLPYLWIDLGSMQPISLVRLFLATDTAQTRNNDIAISVYDDSYNLVKSNYTAVHPPVLTLPGHDFPNNKEYILFPFDSPVSGRFVQINHTDYTAEYLVISECEVLKSYSTPPAINILQAPTNQIVPVNGSATLSVAASVSGANQNYLSYQWTLNGADISGANGPTYTTPALAQIKNYSYGVKLLLPGLTVSTQAVVTVTSDIAPPTITTNWFTFGSAVNMTIVYDELVNPSTATNASNYRFSGGPAISGLKLLPDGKSVTFTVSGLESGDNYSLAVSGIKDLVGNTLKATNLTGTMPAYQINFVTAGSASAQDFNPGYPPSAAIDGNLGNFYHSEWNGAYPMDNEWWEVDLGAKKTIGEIKIQFRGQNRDRDQNILVTVLDNPTDRNVIYSNFLGAAIPPNPSDLLIKPTVSGQIVRVEHPPGISQYLTLNEVSVMPPSLGFSITRPPSSVMAVTNTAAEFSVAAQGAGPFTYQWSHAGTNLVGATNQTLHIPSAGMDQAGSYTVTVTSPYRTHTSTPAVLTLVPPALVTPILKINFDGTLSGNTYALGPDELDVTGTFAAITGGEQVADGAAALSSSAAGGQGFTVANTVLDKGSGIESSFIAEMLFAPTSDFVQGTGQNSGYADIFSFGSTWWSDNNHGDGTLALRYTSGNTFELWLDSYGSLGGLLKASVPGTNVPLPRVTNHIAMVYVQGPGLTNNALQYYLNGDLIATMPISQNVGSSSAGSVFAAFGQAAPGASPTPRGLDGTIDAIAYSTFTGVFSPRDNFVLHQPVVSAPQLSISGPVDGELTLTWDAPGCVVQENSDLNNLAGWVDLDGGGSSPVKITIAPGSKFYRLRK